MRTVCFLIACCAVATSCGGDSPHLSAALATINIEDFSRHVQDLAADSMEGRAPASLGETRTVGYLQREFERIGLEPASAGSYLQEVPLVAITADPRAQLTVRGDRWQGQFRYGAEFMAWTKRVAERVDVSGSEMVFVGYGIVAPEYGWNDYEDFDVTGKTVVIVVNDPGYATGTPDLFNGRAMTYYGRWTYKYEEAARQGAAAALIIHQTGPAGYGWDVVSGSWSGRQFDLVAPDDNMWRVKIEGWMSEATARAVFDAAGYADMDSVVEAAAAGGFEPFSLGLTASVSLRNTVERSASNNVVGILPGSARPDEYVVYMAHWDHLGRDVTREGDQIFNGAFDNATGTSGLLVLANAFASLPEPPARSVVFLAVTAEEKGLLGSKYYAMRPVFPLHQTVAAINMDGINVDGPMNDITIVGFGNSELDVYLEEAARTQSRTVRADPEPEKGFYYRSDHFEFAKQGVPALYPDAGVDHVEHGEEWTKEQRDIYTTERYHKPADEYSVDWDLRGAIDDLRLFFRVGYELATGSEFPNWSEGTEFRAVRDSMMGRH